MPTTASRSRQIEADQRFRWTRERYEHAVDRGVFTTDDKIELLDGEVVAQMSQNELHAVVTGLVSDVLRGVFGTDAHARDEKPIALSEASEPEPDVAMVRGGRREYLDGHPQPEAVLLLVEVSDTSLIQDRFRKAALYADAGIPEYWIVNLVDRVLEVHRDPAGDAYRTKTTLGPDDSVAPLARPETLISVADLLP